jgi:hypothetical protein
MPRIETEPGVLAPVSQPQAQLRVSICPSPASPRLTLPSPEILSPAASPRWPLGDLPAPRSSLPARFLPKRIATVVFSTTRPGPSPTGPGHRLRWRLSPRRVFPAARRPSVDSAAVPFLLHRVGRRIPPSACRRPRRSPAVRVVFHQIVQPSPHYTFRPGRCEFPPRPTAISVEPRNWG